MPLFALGLAALLATAPDTIYTRSQKIACTVKEVSPEAVRYVYPGEEVVNVLYASQVYSIRFASGRVQTFEQTMRPPVLASPLDWQKVVFTHLEGDVKSLIRIGEISATAKGATVYSGTQKVRERAEDKLKMQAAMMGASVIYLMGENVSGHQVGGKAQAGHAAETAINGIAYAERLPTAAEFKAKAQENTIFHTLRKTHYANDQFAAETVPYATGFTLTGVEETDGKAQLRAKVSQGGAQDLAGLFTLVGLDADSFFVQYTMGRSLYVLEVGYK